jgi:hypothetical protein
MELNLSFGRHSKLVTDLVLSPFADKTFKKVCSQHFNQKIRIRSIMLTTCFSKDPFHKVP